MPNIYIAVFRPRSGNYYHWALYVESAPPSIIEVTDSHPDFKFNVTETNPESTDRHVESIKVGEANDRDMPEFYATMRAVKVDNETVDWNCQDYVLEGLEALSKECVLDEDDDDYKNGIRRAKRKYFGPM